MTANERQTNTAARLRAPLRAYAAWCNGGAARKIGDFLHSPFFVYALAALTAVLSVVKIDALTYSILAAAGCVALLFGKDALPALVTALFLLLGRGDCKRALDTPAVACLCVFGSLAGLCALWHVAVHFDARRFTGGKLTLGYIALTAALAAAGFFYPGYTAGDAGASLKFIAYITVIYFTVRGFVTPSKQSLGYFMRAGMAYGVTVGIQLCVTYLTSRTLIESGFDKSYMIVGWGISNQIGEALFRAIPCCFYLMCTEEKHNWLYCAAAALLQVLQLFTFSRASLLFTLPLFCVCLLLCVLFGKNRKQAVLCCAVLAAAAVLALIAVSDYLTHIIDYFRSAGFGDSGRFAIWTEGVNSFLRYPVFGAGMRHGEYATGHLYYHNTLVQFLGCGGALGVGAYLWHRAQTAALFTQKPTLDRTFLGILIAGVLLISLLDCFYFNISSQIFMCYALVHAEEDLRRALPFAYRKKKRYARLF